jgi:hypothetical protein
LRAKLHFAFQPHNITTLCVFLLLCAAQMINWVNVGFSAAELFFDVEPDVGVEISSNFRKMGAASAVCVSVLSLSTPGIV